MMKFPWMSPYVAFDNNPVFYTDPFGLEATNDGGDEDPPFVNGSKVSEIEEVTVSAKKYKAADAGNVEKKVPGKLPTDVGKSSTVNIRYDENRNNIRNDLYTYKGNGEWQHDRYTNGYTNPVSNLVKGNPNVGGFTTLDDYFIPDLTYSNGGAQGGTCTTCGDKKGSGVSTNSSTPTTGLMGAEPTANSPTPGNVLIDGSKKLLEDPRTGVAGSMVGLAAKSIGEAAELVAKNLDNIAKVPLWPKGPSINLSPNAVKVANAVKLLGTTVGIGGVAVSLYNLYHAKTASERFSASADAIIGTVSLFPPAAALGLVYFGIRIFYP
jgi:hypothetical protein